jgi:sn-glycerol 3-phosphate transport system ATP-binding protein
MVFQSYALYPQLSVRDNMGFGLRLAGQPKATISAQVDAAAQSLGLTELLDRFPRQLSGGQRQRVAMGRAIVRQPQVFLFDEPLSNLDAKLRAQTRLEIQKLHRELGITSLFVTHDQVEAMTLAQRMIVMNAGVMEQFGTPREVYARPATSYVASFIGSPPMNLLKAAPGSRPGTLMGVRPEHLDVASSGWQVQVETVELLGAERLVYGRLGSESLILRLDEGRGAPAPGSTLTVAPRPDRLHWFSAFPANFQNPLNGAISTAAPAVNPNLPNGITIFPGGFPLYRNGVMVGAIGVSGDGIDQDDIAAASGAAAFPGPKEIRADRFAYRGARLPYAKFPRNPAL